MSNKTFQTISRNDCLIVYKEIIENSNVKWNAGKKLAAEQDYGTATSMAIISVEEMIKALVIFLDGNGFDFRKVQGIDSIFTNHKIRYLIAYFMFVVCLFGDELIKGMHIIKNEPEKAIELKEELKNPDVVWNKWRFYILRKLVLLKEELFWFSKVDVFRQDGFYCDFKDYLKSPIHITENDYQKLFEKLEKVRNAGNLVVELFNAEDEESIKSLKEMRIQIKKSAFYFIIGNTLVKMKPAKQNPFEIFKENFKSKYATANHVQDKLPNPQ